VIACCVGVGFVEQQNRAHGDAIIRYLRQERPPYSGRGADEPLFLTEDGGAFSEGGRDQMAKRLEAALAKEGIAFYQHRFRSTRAQHLHAAGVPDSSIVEMLGWVSSPVHGCPPVRRPGPALDAEELPADPRPDNRAPSRKPRVERPTTTQGVRHVLASFVLSATAIS